MGCTEVWGSDYMGEGNGDSDFGGNKVTKQANLNQLKAGRAPRQLGSYLRAHLPHSALWVKCRSLKNTPSQMHSDTSPVFLGGVLSSPPLAPAAYHGCRLGLLASLSHTRHSPIPSLRLAVNHLSYWNRAGYVRPCGGEWAISSGTGLWRKAGLAEKVWGQGLAIM